MNNLYDFDELEPRITPQPTVLKCVTTPSVPEVSLIFGKPSDTSRLSAKNSYTPEEKGHTYANWKKDGFPSIVNSRVFTPSPVKRLFNCESLPSNNAISNNYGNSYTRNNETNYNAESPTNTLTFQSKQNQIALNKKYMVASARNSNVDNAHSHNCKHPYQDETTTLSYPRNEIVETPVQNDPYYAVKSILKNPLSNKSSSATTTDNTTDCCFRRNASSQSDLRQAPRNIEDSHRQCPSPVPRCQRTHEVDNQHDTVRDLLLLVQNQSKQIKSLQSQVERLLQTHEQNMGYREITSGSAKPTGNSQSPGFTHECDKGSKKIPVCGQKTCHSRGIKMISSHSSDESPEVCLRYPNEQLRNTIMEKKVSIGVMTSFEFTVQNNPFVTESDNDINAVLRECGKNMNEPSEAWRSNIHCARTVATGPLENINEDSESHPSSSWKQSSNNTQVSSQTSEKYPTNFPAKLKDGTQNKDVNGRPRNTGTPRSNSNTNESPVMFFNKPANSPMELGNFSSDRDKQELVPGSNRQMQSTRGSPGALPSSTLSEEKKSDSYRASDRIVEIHQNSGQPEVEARSTLPENTAEGSFVLSSSDLRVTDPLPPSPDPSIHVEMREYSSDDENEKTKYTPAVGWTFYKNVVGQVNRILHTIPDSQDTDVRKEEINPRAFQNELDVNDDILDSVKLATLERLQMLGINYTENSEFNPGYGQKKVTFDSTYRPPLDYQTNMAQSANSVTETNTSMHMKALALKYLSDEQLADLAVNKQGSGSNMKQKFISSVHGTNMSLATMNYLQRYCLVSGMNAPQTEVGEGQASPNRQKKLKQLVMTKEVLAQSAMRHQPFDSPANRRESDNILDITTLKQQPKLL